MIDKSSLLKSQGSLYLEFIPEDGLFHKMLNWDFKLVGVTYTRLLSPHWDMYGEVVRLISQVIAINLIYAWQILELGLCPLTELQTMYM